MTTGLIQNWTGNITDIGPMYPFVGSEVFLVIIGVAFWIIWHIWQTKMENEAYREDTETYGDRESLTSILIDRTKVGGK